MYAGVNGNHTYQGNPPGVKWSPRVGVAYSFNRKLVLRGGYGMFCAPYNYPAPSTSSSNYGQGGDTQNTVLPQATPIPTGTLDNADPNGLLRQGGNSRAALSGRAPPISFVDKNRKPPRVQQYSADVQFQLPDNMAISFGYVGARGDMLGLGGSADTPVNIN